MDLALNCSILVLSVDSNLSSIALYSILLLSLEVSRTPAEGVESFDLTVVVGEEESQLVESSTLLSVCLRLETKQLAAVEGTHVIGLSVYCEGRKLCSAHVVAEDLLNIVVSPCSGNYDCRSRVCREVCNSRGAYVVLGALELVETLCSDEAFGAVEGIVYGCELTFAVCCPLGLAACCKEEGSNVPCGCVCLHGEVLACCFACSDELFEASEIFCLDDALVVIHEVSVIRGQRISVDLAAGGSCCYSGLIVVLGDGLACAFAELSDSRALNESCQLVLSEEVKVRCCGNVGEYLGSCIGLGHFVYCSNDLDAKSVGLVEVFDLLGGEFLSFAGAPDKGFVFAGQLAGR